MIRSFNSAVPSTLMNDKPISSHGTLAGHLSLQGKEAWVGKNCWSPIAGIPTGKALAVQRKGLSKRLTFFTRNECAAGIIRGGKDKRKRYEWQHIHRRCACGPDSVTSGIANVV
jgi:hypothetical protein